MSSRKYSDPEVRDILARAIDDPGAEANEGTRGLSLDEIKEIGAGVGVDAAAIERAARSSGAIEQVRSRRWVGAPTTLRVERRVGGQLDAVERGELLSVIRSEMSRPGSLTDSDGVVEWQDSGELGRRVITLSTAGDETRVSAMGDLGQAAVVTHLPPALLGLIASIVGFVTSANVGNEVGMVLSALIVPGVLFAARRAFGWISRTESRKLERVVENLESLVEGTGRD